QLPHWNRWRAITRLAPIAILPRPGETRRALAGPAAKALRRSRHPARRAPVLAVMPAPAWTWLPIRENPLSATELRARAKRRS
ncbi:MAG TPA: nicotinate-nicotinamide nucleotide adenylyltransferase, partial [Acidiphilium sp.]